MRLLVLLLVVLASHLQAIENSIIPEMEKYEEISNLPVEKYARDQYAEIKKALSHKADRIRVMTYNTLHDGRDKELVEVNRWPQRLPRIVDLIRETKPDIIGIQELKEHQMNELLPFLQDTYDFYGKEGRNNFYDGIFYRKNRFELTGSHVWLMDSTEFQVHNTLTMVQLKDLKTGSQVAVFNTHLAYFDLERRVFESRFIASHVQTFFKRNIPVIVTGDFNFFPNRLDLVGLPFLDGDYSGRIVKSTGLKDAEEISLVGHLGPIATYTSSPDEITGAPFRGLGKPGVILDHIYVSNQITVLLHAVQPATVGGHFPSDHMPVVADLLVNSKLRDH